VFTRWSRRAFLAGGTLSVGAMAVHARAEQASTGPAPQRPPRLALEMVQEFVAKAHGDLDRTHAMLDAEPGLVNATWDWGGGDWETGLGGASHMGRPDIATFLLSRGARMDVFCAAMLGRVAIVKAFLDADPSVVTLKGPHGISLLRHAEAGKQQAIIDLVRSAGSA
jgi:hypothetical protein